MFVVTISGISTNMGHVGLTSRSPVQILGNSCLHSRDQICAPILMKLCQNICFGNIQANFKNMSCLVKIQVIRSNLRKLLFFTLEATLVTGLLRNLVRKIVLTISRPRLKLFHVQSKTRSPGHILGNSCLHSRGHICYPILMKLCQNVCFKNVQANVEYGSCRVKNQVTRSMPSSNMSHEG